MTDSHVQRMLRFVTECGDPVKLRQVAKNADDKGVEILARAARRKLYGVLPAEEPGTLEYAVWQSIFALGDVLKQERGKTILLSRTRQKIARQGVTQCVADLVPGTVAGGFGMLLERKMLDLSFEAIALQLPEKFDEKVLSAARRRLADAGYLTDD